MRGGSINWALPHNTEINTININTEILVPMTDEAAATDRAHALFPLNDLDKHRRCQKITAIVIQPLSYKPISLNLMDVSSSRHREIYE